MRVFVASMLVLTAWCWPAFARSPTVVSGLKNPESAVVGPGGKVYVTVVGERDKLGDGAVVIVDRDSGKITTFADCLDDPKGMVAVGDALYVADLRKVWKIDSKGKVEIFLEPEDFPRRPVYLLDIAYDGQGAFFISDMGDRLGRKGAVYRVDARKNVLLVLDGELTSPQVTVPSGLFVDDPDHVFVADYGLGYLYRYSLITGTPQRICGGFGGTYGLAMLTDGNMFASDWRNGRIFEVMSELEPPDLLPTGRLKLQSPADIALTPDGRDLLIPDTNAGTLTWFPLR